MHRGTLLVCALLVCALLVCSAYFVRGEEKDDSRHGAYSSEIERTPLHEQREESVRQQMIAESIAEYPQICPCPYSYNEIGERCGDQSIYQESEGRYPLCYQSDIDKDEFQRYWERARSQGARSAAYRWVDARGEGVLPADERTPKPYRRASFGNGWIDADGDCLDTREEVLIAQSLQPVQLSADGCRVISGIWFDLYTGDSFTDPRALDVDHFIPLREAYISGAFLWSEEERVMFANNLSDPHLLIAVSAAANRDKGHRDPHEWLPPNTRFRCSYLQRWIALKKRYALVYDDAEFKTVEKLWRECHSL